MKSRAARSKAVAAAPAGAAAAPAAPKKPIDPLKFIREVQAEGRKITWTSRRETWITSVMVFIMVVLASIFFFVTDTALAFAVGQVLRLATAG